MNTHTNKRNRTESVEIYPTTYKNLAYDKGDNTKIKTVFLKK